MCGGTHLRDQQACLALAHHTNRAVAVLIGQRVIGTKLFKKGETK